MTLNLTLVAPWGVWQSADHRLTDPATGDLVDDFSMKHVAVSCPDGAALITYTGIGMVNDTHISDWLRGVVRGRTRSLDDTLILIRERASRWISPIAGGRYHHIFSSGAFLAGHPWAIVISNIQPVSDWWNLPPTREFHTSAKMIEDEPIAMVTGARDAVAVADMELLKRVVKRRPKRIKDFHKLLAGVNLRASEHPKSHRLISSTCVTAHMPPKGEPIQTEMHGWKSGEDRAVPMVFRGIDLTDWSQVLTDQLKKVTDPNEDEKAEEFRRRLEEAARRGIHSESGRL